MNLFFLIVSFLLGTAVGSFVNALVFRLRRKMPVAADRSVCDHCHKQIANRDLVPLFSYLLLGGRCRHCGKIISPEYPLTELLLGLLFAGSFYQYFGLVGIAVNPVLVFSFLSQLFFITVLLILLLYDLKFMELPDQVVLPAIVAAVLIDGVKVSLSVWDFRQVTERLPLGPQLLSDQSFFVGHVWELASPYAYGALAGLVLAVIFYLIVWLSKERAMGGGDIKLAVLLGLILPWPYLVPAMYLGFMLGAVVGLGLVLLNRKKMRQLIPLAPFLVTGVLAAIFFGNELYQFLITVKPF